VTLSSESVSADMKAVEEFLQTLAKLIMEGLCFPEQIFHIGEICLHNDKIAY
jgi:hypothetical protein